MERHLDRTIAIPDARESDEDADILSVTSTDSLSSAPHLWNHALVLCQEPPTSTPMETADQRLTEINDKMNAKFFALEERMTRLENILLRSVSETEN